MKPKHREQAYQLANIGHWELELQNDELNWNEELYWSDEIKALHEVPLDYQPTLEDAVKFYEEGENRQKIQAAVENAIKNGESYVIESKIITAQGNQRWVRSTGEPVFENGQCIRLFGSTQNITDLKKKEEKIEAQQKELQMFMENSPDGMMIASPDGRIHKANKAACNILGMKESEIIAKGRDGLVYNDEKFQQALKRREKTGQFSGELNFIHKSGEKIPVELTTSVYTNPKGEPRTSIVIRDITERKKTEQKLQDIIEHSTNLFFRHGTDHKFTYLSPQSKKFLGCSPEEAKSKWTEFITDNPVNKQGKYYTKKAIETGKTQPAYQMQLKKKTGEIIWVRVNEAPVVENGETVTIVGALTDITEQIKHEQQLKDSIERYHYATKATFDVIWDWYLKNDIIYWGEGGEDLSGYYSETMSNEISSWTNNIHPDDKDWVGKSIKKAVAGTKQHWSEEYRYLNADGSYSIVEDRGYIIRDSNQKATRMIGAMRDVSEQKEQEKQLREINRKNRLILESTAEGIYGIDTEGKCTFINKAASKMLGYRSQECLGKSMHELIHHKHANGEHYPESECPILISKNIHESCRVTDEVFWRADGSCFDVEYTSNPMIEDGKIKGAVVFFSDITERKQHERALKDSLKEKDTLLMEIHHRVKNNLAVVSGLMQLQAFSSDDELLSEKLNQSVDRIKTMASIHELLYKSDSFSCIEADKSIELLITEITQTFEPSIFLDTEFDLENIQLNINQAIPLSLIINEVVTNILKHAFTGKDQGKLTVTISESNQKVSFRIKDNGNGLPEDFPSQENRDSLGLLLIDTLSSQLQANYKYESISGETHFTLTFKITELKGSGSAFVQ
ncbi:MAG: PAS domain S-box protein [Gracilimonas sp.]